MRLKYRKGRSVIIAAVLALVVGSGQIAWAHDEPMNLDELMGAFGWDFASAESTLR